MISVGHVLVFSIVNPVTVDSGFLIVICFLVERLGGPPMYLWPVLQLNLGISQSELTSKKTWLTCEPFLRECSDIRWEFFVYVIVFLSKVITAFLIGQKARFEKSSASFQKVVKLRVVSAQVHILAPEWTLISLHWASSRLAPGSTS